MLHPIPPFVEPHGRIYLFRHGLVDESDRKRFIGRTDVALSLSGRNQAECWKPVLKGLQVDRVLTSDLKRSRQFARILFDRSVPFFSRCELNEINLGPWEGLAREEVKRLFPNDYLERGRDLANHRLSGGESFGDVAVRVQPILEKFRRGTESVLVVVGHAGVNRVILADILGMPLADVMRLGQDYGCLNVIERYGRRLEIKRLNLPVPY
jgi:broad specificity phosphatase PhoE